jgi:hypothetical protein
MGIATWIELRADHVRLTCRGDFCFKDALQMIEAAFAAAINSGRPAVLIDALDLGGAPPTTLERFDMGAYAAKRQHRERKLVRIAVVGEEPMIDPCRFGETVARNRGAMVGVFTDFGEALAWLGMD